MHFRIHHELDYRYERPVFLEPMTLRLMPRQDAFQRLGEHHLEVRAPAAGCTSVLEPDGGEARVLWFEGERDRLQVEVTMAVETLRTDPFDWIVTHPPALRLPAAYPEAEAAALVPCLEPAGTTAPIAAAVREWAEQRAAEVEHDTTAFLLHLADVIHHQFHHVGRMDGDPMPAEECLAGRSGACRDTAVLFLAACRSQGLAARFVSGYSIHHPPEVSEQELHAWAEVYLPGGGWRGYDPSLGLAVADGHLVLTAAADPRQAAPVSGRYRGTGVASELRYRVRLSADD